MRKAVSKAVRRLELLGRNLLGGGGPPLVRLGGAPLRKLYDAARNLLSSAAVSLGRLRK